jgi:hypothetical protein
MTGPRHVAEILDGLVLTADEVAELVKRDPAVWVRALHRGKYHRRAEQTERRR